MLVTDNALDENDFQKIRETLFAEYFPWYLNPSVLYLPSAEQIANTDLRLPLNRKPEVLQCDTLDNYQFTHGFVQRGRVNSDFDNVLAPLYEFLQVRTLFRVKANMNPRTQQIVVHGAHYDTPWDDAKVAILHVTTDDGFTLIHNDDGSTMKIDTVANRVIRFGSNVFHSGSTCTNQQVRVVVNVIYF